MTERAYGRYIDYVNVASKNVIVEIRVLQNETKINGQKILTDKWLLPEQWQELYSVLQREADKHINEKCNNLVRLLGNTIHIVLEFEPFLPAYQYILKPYKCNIDDLEECLRNPGPEWMETHPYEFMIKAVISPINLNMHGNSLSTASYISESDKDERMENNTERNVEDMLVPESDNDLNSSIPSKLPTSFIIPESECDDSFSCYSQPIPTVDSQNMCYTEKISKYSGLPIRIYRESLDISECNSNLNVPYSQAECLNGEEIAPESNSSSKYVKSLEHVFGDSSHTTGKLDFQSRNKRKKIIATEALDVGFNTSGCNVQSLPEIHKSSKKIKVNENGANTLQSSDKNKRDKRKLTNFNKIKEPRTKSCSIEISSDDEGEYIDKKSPTTFKLHAARNKPKRALSKKKNDGKSTIENFFPKVTSPENIKLNTSINTGSHMENVSSKEHSPQMPDILRKPLYHKCKSLSSENSVDLSVKTKKHVKLSKTIRDKPENKLSKNPPEKRKSHHQKLSTTKADSPSSSRKSQNKNNDANIEVSNEILEERKKFRVSHLSLEELENIYIKHKKYLVGIFSGKQPSWRQDEFCKGRASSQDLRFSISTIPFTDAQIHHLINLLRQTFCERRSFVQYFDYLMKVMIPEITTRIFMDTYSLSQTEALNKLRHLYFSTPDPLEFGI